MKKKKKNNYFRTVFMMIAMSLTLISCGQSNKSGQTNNGTIGNFGTISGFGNNGAIGGFNYSGITSANGLTLPSNWLQVIAQENTCRTPNFGTQITNTQERVRYVVDLTGFNVNAGAAHVGVTAEGDITIISLQAQGPVMEILACNRPDLSPNVTPTGNFVVNTSNSCPISEVTSANVQIPSSLGFGGYTLAFFPIHIPGTQQFSSLCFNGF